jgi:hypothetical protein
MALARVVSFEGVNRDRIDEMKREMNEASGRPEGVPATEIIVLHDGEAEKSLAILFFENEDDYRTGDEALNAMPVTSCSEGVCPDAPSAERLHSNPAEGCRRESWESLVGARSSTSLTRRRSSPSGRRRSVANLSSETCRGGGSPRT